MSAQLRAQARRAPSPNAKLAVRHVPAPVIDLCPAVGQRFCSAESGRARATLFLITLDTTRADRMGFLGSKRGLTPNLDALAGRVRYFPAPIPRFH